MIVLIILGILFLILFLIMMISIGIDLRFEDGVIRLSAKVSRFRLQLLPKKKKEKTEEKPEKKSENKQEKKKPEKEKRPKKEKKSTIHLDLYEILDLLGVVFRGVGKFCRKWKVERFILHWIAAGFDPYTLAKIFIYVNDALSQLAPVCDNRFHVKDCSVWTDIDFTRDDMFFEFGLTTTIRIGQIVGVGLYIAFGALKILLKSKKRNKKEAKEAQKMLEQIESAA